MPFYEVIASAENKRIHSTVEVPERWVSQANIESFCRGWLKVQFKVNGVSILSTRLPTRTTITEEKPEKEKNQMTEIPVILKQSKSEQPEIFRVLKKPSSMIG